MFEGEFSEAVEACQKAFPNGWLSPEGKFVMVEYTKHDESVFEVTGYGECDDACDHGWLKFMAGNPYNHDGESVFNEDADRSKVTTEQRAWLNEWLVSVSEPGARYPVF